MGDFIHFVHAGELLVGYGDCLNPEERQCITPRSILCDFLRSDVMKIAVVFNGKTFLWPKKVAPKNDRCELIESCFEGY